MQSAPVRARAADDHTVRITVTGLAPATRYYYRMLVDGIPDRYRLTPFATRTAPAGAAPFRLAFGSCARHQLDAEQPIFRAISGGGAGCVLLARRQHLRRLRLGMGIRGGLPPPAFDRDDAAGHAFRAAARDLGRPRFRAQQFGPHEPVARGVARRVPATTGRTRVWPAGRTGRFLPVRVWRRRLLHAGRPLLPHAQPGPDGPEKTLLGRRQGEWLREALLASRAPFKVLACGSGWSSEDGPTGDTWARLPDRAQRALRLHPRQPHRGRVPDLRATRISAR